MPSVSYPRITKWFAPGNPEYKEAGIRFRLWTNVPRRLIKLLAGKEGQTPEELEEANFQFLSEVVVDVQGLDGISFDTPEQVAHAYAELDSALIEFIFDCFWYDREQRRSEMKSFQNGAD